MGGTYSDGLTAFIAGNPLIRPRIAAFIADCARQLPEGSRVLDAGAGNAPYRELFAHCRYTTSDWANSPHPGARAVDIVAPIDALPVADGSFDVIVLSEVLEHVADPAAALRELHRALAGGGRLHLTVPFVYALHEEPYDFFRYTRHGLERLLADAGFTDVEVRPLTGYLSALGQVLRFYTPSPDGPRALRLPRRILARAVQAIGPPLGRLDRGWGGDRLPLGYCASATKAAVDAP
ncbi:unannotated protein [freshwater metagenome]|uniref:Unannotated protein n=1 Tax=freshwater metagenome TaxID=449393 RepID=A0A6J7HQG6_9ZZZZ|nr:methyltransferase domain-containing protein [Actinomycetota bacterium]